MVQIKEIASTAVDGAQLYLEAQDYYPYLQSAFYIGVVTATGYVFYKIAAPAIKRLSWKPNHNSLKGKVAIVTGASRGVGKGVALGLAEAGATVYVTGRTENTIQGSNLGSINETALQCNGFGGKGIAVVCDHSKDIDIAALFEQVIREQGKIDILVNNVTQIPADIKPPYNENIPFWESGLKLWDPIMNVGLRSHFIASVHAAQLMTKQQNGVIVNISSEGAQNYLFFLAYGVQKCALDRMTKDMAHELRPYNVATISLWPGLVKTEKNMEYADYIRQMWKVDLEDKGESPIYTGRAVAALCSDSKIINKSGQSLTNYCVASEYGVTDIDGRQPYAPGTFSFYLDHLTSVTKKRIFGH